MIGREELVAARKRNARNRAVALENAERFADIARAASDISRAIRDDDHIIGPLASSTFLDALTSLPTDLRADIAEAVSDDAARGLRADRLYLEQAS